MIQTDRMTALLKLIAALAKILDEFADAGGVQILIEAWTASREQSKARARLADEQRLASALARGDLDAVESHAERLLVAAEGANRDRGSPRDLDRSDRRDGDDHDGAVGADHSDANALQRQIAALID